jgi:uncharacterized membrane protein YkvA (DUF1232 family)
VAQFKVVFTLDEEDVAYYRALYRQTRKNAKDVPAERIIEDARAVVQRVRASKKTPSFVNDSIEVLADLVDLIVDNDYVAPIVVRDSVLAALGYFSNPEDLVPDHVPGIGFLDDAIMIRLVEEEFRHELWGYENFASCAIASSSGLGRTSGGIACATASKPTARRSEPTSRNARPRMSSRASAPAASVSSAAAPA